jgi:prepilin signal peptidase PulO-like enzyme (type II secretory pathway)
VNAAAALAALAPALALGSFLNVVAARVPARRSLLFPPSSCGTCASQIPWRDNIPILSYFLLRGRCRHCSARISSLYPAVEAVTTVLAVACVAVFGPTAYAALAVGFCALLVTFSAIDIKHRIVPIRVPLVPFLSLGAVVALFFGERLLESYLGLF